MRKHEVVFYSPGTFVSETSSREIESWDPRVAATIAAGVEERYSATPYAFRFKTFIVADDVDDGEGGKLRVEPKEVAHSGLHFLGGQLDTLDDVAQRADPKEDVLLSNMRCNDMFIVCVNRENRWRSTIPFDAVDVLCNREGKIIERGDDPKWVEYRKECKLEQEKRRERIEETHRLLDEDQKS